MPERSAVFLDFQGTLGGEGLGDIRDFSFFPYAGPAVRLLNKTGLLVIVLTNQSHIGQGLMTGPDFMERMSGLRSELAADGATLDGVYCCPHAKEDDCECKKPKPGLALQAQEDFGLDFSTSYLVGDSGANDMVLAREIGCRAVLVKAGLGESSLGEYRHLWDSIEPDFIAEDVLDAVCWILQCERRR